MTPPRLAGRISFFFRRRTPEPDETDRRPFLQAIPRYCLARHRFDDDEPVGVVVLGVDRRLDRVEEPQVLRVVSEGQLLARQEVQVLNRPATPRGDATARSPSS